MKSEEEKAAAEIMHYFRHFYKDQWAPGNIFDGKSRVWVKVFNNLIKNKLIEKKKTEYGYKYRWAAAYPSGV